LLDPETPGELPTQYARARALIASAPEALVKAYGLRPTNETIERMQNVIEPSYGETGEQYSERIKNTLNKLYSEQIGISENQLASGFKLNEKHKNENVQENVKMKCSKSKPIPNGVPESKVQGMLPPKGTVWMQDINGNRWHVAESKIEEAKNLKMADLD